MQDEHLQGTTPRFPSASAVGAAFAAAASSNKATVEPATYTPSAEATAISYASEPRGAAALVDDTWSGGATVAS